MDSEIFKKEFLPFTLPSDLPPEEATHIKQASESLLFTWQNYPIVLPSSSLTPDASKNVSLLSKLLTTSSFDELTDNGEERQKLSKEQLESIKKRGKFDVRSKRFPGHFHTWRLSLFLSKGSERAFETLLCDCALALRLILVTAKGRISSSFFSLKSALWNIAKGLWQIMDMLFGMPQTKREYSHLEVEYKKFLVAELNCSVFQHDIWLSSDVNMLQERPDYFPIVLQGSGTNRDLTLCSEAELVKKAILILKTIFDKGLEDWYTEFKKNVILELQGQDMTTKQFNEKLEMRICEEYIRQLFTAIESNNELESLHHDLGKLLVKHIKCHAIFVKINNEIMDKFYCQKEQLEAELKKLYPARCKIQPWMQEQMNKFKKEFIERNSWLAHEKAVEECQQQGLQETAYFLQRDLSFRRDRKPLPKDDARELPLREYDYKMRITWPCCFPVTKTTTDEEGNSQTETISTILHLCTDYEEDPSTACDGVKYETSEFAERHFGSGFFGWRCYNLVLRAWFWTSQVIHYLFVGVILRSPIGVGAVCCCYLLYPYMRVSDGSGALYRYTGDEVQLPPLILAIGSWFDIANNLTKSCKSECVKRFLWVILVIIVTPLILLVYPLTSLIVSLLALVLAITTVVWAPIASILAYLVCALVYDFDHAGKGNRLCYFFEALSRIIVAGILQFLVSALVALCLLLASLSVFLFAVVRWFFRRVWDTLLFHLIVKRCIKLPASDMCGVHRVSGPGPMSSIFYQILPEQVLIAVQAHMETDALQVWLEVEQSKITSPSREFESFVKDHVEPLSTDSNWYSSKLETMKVRENEIKQNLLAVVDERRKLLEVPLNQSLKNRIRINRQNLIKSFTRTAIMAERFYPTKVFSLMNENNVQEFWHARNLKPEDWKGLAAYIICHIFSSQFLVPLEESDTCFLLQTDEHSLVELMKRLSIVELPDDLPSAISTFYLEEFANPKRPLIESFLFVPKHDEVDYYSEFYNNMKTNHDIVSEWQDLVLLPLPSLHPIVVGILVSNRENSENKDVKLLSGNSYAKFILWLAINIGIAVPDLTANARTSCLLSNLPFVSKQDSATLPIDDGCLHMSDANPLSSSVLTDKADEAFVDREVPEKSEVLLMNDTKEQLIYSEEEMDNSCVVFMNDGKDGVHSN